MLIEMTALLGAVWLTGLGMYLRPIYVCSR